MKWILNCPLKLSAMCQFTFHLVSTMFCFGLSFTAVMEKTIYVGLEMTSVPTWNVQDTGTAPLHPIDG